MFQKLAIRSGYSSSIAPAIAILPLGEIDHQVLYAIKEGLSKALIRDDISLIILEKASPPLKEAYNPHRQQFHATKILTWVDQVARDLRVLRVLGVVDVDLYVPYLNFVFGEAKCPGRSALISLYRLRPEFYGEPPNASLFKERAVKEAVHEIGHTFGLTHCTSSSCVMFFSNSILDTDAKSPYFCASCEARAHRLLSWFLEEAEAKAL